MIQEVKKVTAKKERVLITTLTKRMAEDLSEYLSHEGISVSYLHSEVKTIERSHILKSLREEKFKCVVGVNLLREGLDLPEVSLVIIMDADKEGFLRSFTSLIQVSGRAARNINGRVIMYADTYTKSMKKAIEESLRRRELQLAYNKKKGITPKTIQKAIREGIEIYHEAEKIVEEAAFSGHDSHSLIEAILEAEKKMCVAADNFDFERAIEYRESIKSMKKELGARKVSGANSEA